MNSDKKFSIVGGGIAGLTTAIALQKIGVSPIIFEGAPEIKPLGAGIVLAANAMKAFQKLGLAEKIMAGGNQLTEFIIKDQKGKTITRTDISTFSKQVGIGNFAIHRAALHAILLEHVEPGTVVTNKKLIALEKTKIPISLLFEDGTRHETNYIIAADGIHSLVRQELLPFSQPRFAGYTCWRAVIDNNTIHLPYALETWGRKGRFGAVRLAPDKIYWFACLNANAHDPVMKQFVIQDLLKYFGQYHAPIPEILEATSNDSLIHNDILDIKPIKQFAFDNILLVGDAAHATTPNLGQGACQAIEDAMVLANSLDQYSGVQQAYSHFNQLRQEKTTYIIKTSHTLGNIAQWTNPLAVTIRNSLFRALPDRMNQQQLLKLYEVQF